MAFLLKPLKRRRKGSKILSLVELMKTQQTKLPCVVCITDIDSIADPTEDIVDHFKVGDIILLERKLQVQYIRFEVLENGSETDPKTNNQRQKYVGKEFLIPLEYEGFVTTKHKTYSKRTYYSCLTEVEKNDLKLIQVEEDTLSFTMKAKADFIPVQKGIKLQRKGSVQYEKQRFLSFVDHDQNSYFFHEAHPMKFSAFPPILPMLLKDIADISLPRIVSFNVVQKQNVAPFLGMDADKMYTILDGQVRLLETEEREVLIVWRPDLSEVAIIPTGLQSRIFVEICKPTGKSKFFHNSRFVENKLYFLNDSLHQPTLFKSSSETEDATLQDLNVVNARATVQVVKTSDDIQNMNNLIPIRVENEELDAILNTITFNENPLYNEDSQSLKTYKSHHASGDYIDMDQHKDLYEYEVMESPGFINEDKPLNRYFNTLNEQKYIKQNAKAKRHISHPHFPSRHSFDEPKCESEDNEERSEESVSKDCISDCFSFPEEAVLKQKLTEFRQSFDESQMEKQNPISTGEHFPSEIMENSITEKDIHDGSCNGSYTRNVKQESVLCRKMNYPPLPPKPVLKKPYCDSFDRSKGNEMNSEAKVQMCYDSDYEFCFEKSFPKQNIGKDFERSLSEEPAISSKDDFPDEIKERRKREKHKRNFVEYGEISEASIDSMPLIADIPQILEKSYRSENETRGKPVSVCVVRPLVN